MSTIVNATLGIIGIAGAPISMAIRNSLRLGGNKYADNVLLKGIEDGFEKTYQSYLKSSSVSIGEVYNYTIPQKLKRLGTSILVHLHAAALAIWAPFRGILNLAKIGTEGIKTLHQKLVSHLPRVKEDYSSHFRAAIEKAGATKVIGEERIQKAIDRLFNTYSKSA